MTQAATQTFIKGTAATAEKGVLIFRYAPHKPATVRDVATEDLGVDVEKVLGRTVLKLRIFPDEMLKPFGKIQNKMRNIILEKALEVELGYLATRASGLAILRKLDELKVEFENLKSGLEARYDSVLATHLDLVEQEQLDAGKSPDVALAIRRHAERLQPSWKEMDSALSVEWHVVPYTLDEEGFDPDLFEAQKNSVVAIKESALGRIVFRIAQTAGQILANALKTEGKAAKEAKLTVRASTVERMFNLRDLCSEIAFLHPSIAEASQQLDSCLTQFSKGASEGLNGVSRTNFLTLCRILSDQTQLMAKLEAGDPLFITHTVTETGVNSAVSAVASPVTTPAPAGECAAQAATPADESHEGADLLSQVVESESPDSEEEETAACVEPRVAQVAKSDSSTGGLFTF